MDASGIYDRYRELQDYVGWSETDLRNAVAIAPHLEPRLPELIDDFYDQIQKHPHARKVITGGQPQIDRLKGTLLTWIRELFSGKYDEAYVQRRWRVGWRHVEIGLDQVYTNVALSRLRTGLSKLVHENSNGDHTLASETVRSIDKLLDLDLALIEEAYQTEFNSRLQRTERLATLGQVAGGVAHELRNPLNVVKTSVYYLLNAKNATPEKTTEHLHRIERQVTSADGVITALTNFAKMPVPNLLPTPVKPLVYEILEHYPPLNQVVVELSFPESVPTPLADADQLRIVLSNIIRNACDAMPAGGRLSIGAAFRDGSVEVAIADTGIGIPATDVARIMEPLYSTKARGIGLGLAIARAILDKNRGSLGVQSEPGRGSTFTVRLLPSPQASSGVA